MKQACRWDLQAVSERLAAGALRLEVFEGGEGLRQRVRPAPMQQIAIQPVGLEMAKRALASGAHARLRGVVRQHLRDEKDLFPASGDGLADDRLRASVAIHLGRVEMGQAEIEPAP